MTIKNKKGFTLIELLVVIAIIGILSGLIIVSMSGASNSAKVARIQADMDQMRPTAILYFNTNTTYVGLASDTNFAALITDITSSAVGGTSNSGSYSASAYCYRVRVPGYTPTLDSWCVDSTGNANWITTDNLATYCTGATYTCK